MDEAWITLQCPDCTEHWEANPADFDGPSVDYECDACGVTHPLSEFCETKRDLEILTELAA